MPRALLVLFVLTLTSVSSADDALGTVCLGKNLAKPLVEHSDRLYLRIDDSEKRFFDESSDLPRIISDGLDIRADHIVRVYFDDRVVESWRLNFSLLRTNSVLIWRAAGSWRMEPFDAALCR
jgi:hypothetical protein